ncbi:hypothetical protein D3C75_397620 [compost metagenome]
MKEETEIQNEISAIVRNIVMLIRKERNIPQEQIEILINYLKVYRVYSNGREFIPKRMTFELFYLYTRISSQMIYNKEKDKDSTIITELYMAITSVFSDVLYQ